MARPIAQANPQENFRGTDQSTKTVKLFHLERFAIYDMLQNYMSLIIAKMIRHCHINRNYWYTITSCLKGISLFINKKIEDCMPSINFLRTSLVVAFFDPRLINFLRTSLVVAFFDPRLPLLLLLPTCVVKVQVQIMISLNKLRDVSSLHNLLS